MLTKRELLWLHALQNDFAVKRDWVAVAHVQSLIDHIADEHGIITDNHAQVPHELAVH